LIPPIPAHNEQDRIEQAIRSLDGQSSPRNVVVVVADQSTDGPAGQAATAVGQVIESTATRHAYRRALNHSLNLPRRRHAMARDSGALFPPADP
jgi:glycosyltransferase involved in cell wall biosynthesis